MGEMVDAEMVDAEVVDEEPRQRAIGEARRLRVVPDSGFGEQRDDRDLDMLELIRRARAGAEDARSLLDEVSRRAEAGLDPACRTWQA